MTWVFKIDCKQSGVCPETYQSWPGYDINSYESSGLLIWTGLLEKIIKHVDIIEHH